MTTTGPLWEPVRLRRSLPSRIAEHIQGLIAAGELQPGDRLPAERKLADLLAVSRSSVREAVQAMAARGLLSIRHGHGVFIESPAPTRRLDGALLGRGNVVAGQWRVDDFYAMRGALEGPAARWAARNMTPDGATRLEEAYARLAEAAGGRSSPEESWRLNAAFHEAVADAAGNVLLLCALRSLNEMAANTRPAPHVPGLAGRSTAGHAAILEAIRAGDPRGAERASRAHIRAAHRAARRQAPSPAGGRQRQSFSS